MNPCENSLQPSSNARGGRGHKRPRQVWTMPERTRFIEMVRAGRATKDIAPAFPNRTLMALVKYRTMLVREGVVPRQLRATLRRTPELDMQFAVDVQARMTIEALGERYDQNRTTICRWKKALGISKPLRRPRHKNRKIRPFQTEAHPSSAVPDAR